jgi:hypothetical protein
MQWEGEGNNCHNGKGNSNIVSVLHYALCHESIFVCVIPVVCVTRWCGGGGVESTQLAKNMLYSI